MFKKLNEELEERKDNHNIILFVCKDLINKIEYCTEFPNDLRDLNELYSNENVTGSYFCSVPKTKQFLLKYWEHSWKLVEEMEYTDIEIYNSFKLSFFDSIEKAHLILLNYVYQSFFSEITEEDFQDWEEVESFLLDIVENSECFGSICNYGDDF